MILSSLSRWISRGMELVQVINKLKIQITKTATGDGEYVQIMSDDMTSVNVVLIANEIEIRDDRELTKGDGEHGKSG